MWYADGGGVPHLGMLVQHLVDLARIDILAGADDHVALAIDYVVEAIFVFVAEIASVKPTGTKCFARRGVVVVVALHEIRAAHDNLTDPTGWNFVAVLV